MIKVLVEGRTANEMRKNLEAFFASVRNEQSAPIANGQDDEDDMTHLSASAPQPDPEDVEDIDENPVAGPAPHASAGTMMEYGVDSRGFPWDERIHSAGANQKNKNGTWRSRRGVEPSYVVQIEHELLQRMKNEYQEVASPAPLQPVPMVQPAVVATPPPLAIVPPVMASPVIPQMAAQPAPLAQVQVPVAVPPPLPPQQVTLAHTKDTFRAQLIPTLAELTKIGKLTPEYINALKTHFGVDEIWKLSPEQTEVMFDNFVQHGLIQRVG